jgi:hypothetical protein
LVVALFLVYQLTQTLYQLHLAKGERDQWQRPDDVRELPLYLSPESEHWLDWFHVAMRLRVMGQMAKGLVNEQNMTSAQESLTEAGEELDTVDIGKQLERVKWLAGDLLLMDQDAERRIRLGRLTLARERLAQRRRQRARHEHQ